MISAVLALNKQGCKTKV